MKNDKIIEKALSKIAEHMLETSYLPLLKKVMDHCHPVGKQNCNVFLNKIFLNEIKNKK